MARSASGAPVVVDIGPRELADAIRRCVGVMNDHASALDGLASTGSWDGTEGPAEPTGGDASTSDQSVHHDGIGSDLAATLAGACDAVRDDSDFSALCRDLAAGAASSARTEAGRRLAGFLRGAADALRNADRVDGSRFALALEAGAEHVTERDDGTHPGCILAVMTASADAALDASDARADLVEVLVSAAEAGLVELERGPLADADLAARGTVDPAAAGFLLILDSLAAALAGEPLPEPPRGPVPPQTRPGGRFVVRCVVAPPADDIEAAADLEVVLHELSDRLTFDRVGPRWAVDLVTPFPGAAVEALAAAGVLAETHISVADDPPAHGA